MACAARGVEVSGAAVATEIALPNRVAGEADLGARSETGESDCRIHPHLQQLRNFDGGATRAAPARRNIRRLIRSECFLVSRLPSDSHPD